MGNVKLDLDPGAMQDVVGRMSRGMLARGAAVARRRAQENAPRRTGHLAQSIVNTPPESTGFLQYRAVIMAQASYSMYQEEGTRGSRPVHARALRFKPKGSGSYVFAMSTGPVPATRFMQRAVDSLTMGDFL